MFTRINLCRALTLHLGLVVGVAQAQPFGTPQPGYPQPGFNQTNNPQPGFGQAGNPQPGFPQAGYQQPDGYPVPAVMPQPPVRLGFQFAMCDYGMAVTALREGGLAHQVGLLPGDMIVQINTFQITDWNQYCLALHDAVFSRGGQVEMWLYRPTPAGYELQYVAFTIHEEQIIVVVPCCYHVEKCHSSHVSCWVERLEHLNHCWHEHCHDGGKADNHHGLNLNFLGKGVSVNFGNGGINFGGLNQKNGHGNFGGQFGNFQPNQFKKQIQHFNGGSNFQKQNGSGFKPQFNLNNGSNGNSHHRMSNGSGNSHQNSSSQFSRSSGNGGGNMMKSFGGFGKK